jgi:hypothetical protein
MKTTLYLLAFVATTIAAQSSELTVRILYLNAPADAPRELILFDGEDSQRVKLPKMNLSPVYELRSDARAIALLNKVPESVEAVPRAAPRVKIPKGVLDFYLFISPDPSNPVTPVKMTIVDAGSDDFEIGQMLWFNLTDKTIGGNVGGERVVISPNSRHLMDAPVEEASNYPVKLAFTMSGKEQLYPLCQTKWFHNPKSRNVAFIFPQENRRAPRVMVFPDYRQTWRKSEAESRNES